MLEFLHNADLAHEVDMKINCGFCRKRENGKGYEHKNVTGIEVAGLDFRADGQAIREELMRHKPEGEGWSITGYALVSD